MTVLSFDFRECCFRLFSRRIKITLLLATLEMDLSRGIVDEIKEHLVQRLLETTQNTQLIDVSHELQSLLKQLNISHSGEKESVRDALNNYLSKEIPGKLYAPENHASTTAKWNNPTVPKQTIDMIQKELRQIQEQIVRFGYNHTCIAAFFPIKKSMSFNHIMRIARDILMYRMPIKCLEAVVLGVYLTIPLAISTNGLFQRFSISFLTTAGNPKNEYRHIILAVYYDGKFGALGISRRQELMDKPPSFSVSTCLYLLLSQESLLKF